MNKAVYSRLNKMKRVLKEQGIQCAKFTKNKIAFSSSSSYAVFSYKVCVFNGYIAHTICLGIREYDFLEQGTLDEMEDNELFQEIVDKILAWFDKLSKKENKTNLLTDKNFFKRVQNNIWMISTEELLNTWEKGLFERNKIL